LVQLFLFVQLPRKLRLKQLTRRLVPNVIKD
jgi:hypothetical protein